MDEPDGNDEEDDKKRNEDEVEVKEAVITIDRIIGGRGRGWGASTRWERSYGRRVIDGSW